MIPRLYIYAAAALAIIAVIGWQRHAVYESGKAKGRADVTADWQADTKARATADAKIAADAAARLEAARVTNQEVLADANSKLIAIAADRTSLASRLRDYENRLRAATSAAHTAERGIDVATGIARAAEEARGAIERQWDAYDRSCRNDAVRFEALQNQVRPWL